LASAVAPESAGTLLRSIKSVMPRTWASRTCWAGAEVFSHGAESFAVALVDDDVDAELDALLAVVLAEAIDSCAW